MNETLQSLISRKSCKSYTGEHITTQEMEAIIAAGLNAPTGRNLQTPRFVVIQKEEVVRQLGKLNASILGREADPFYGATDVIVVLAKTEGTYVYDGSLAMGNLLTAAWSMGIGACWIHRAKEVFQTAEGKALLGQWGITEEVEGIGFCILGRQDKEKPKTECKPGRVFYV